MQEREGGRHFLYKLDNKPIISAEILNPKRNQYREDGFSGTE